MGEDANHYHHLTSSLSFFPLRSLPIARLSLLSLFPLISSFLFPLTLKSSLLFSSTYYLETPTGQEFKSSSLAHVLQLPVIDTHSLQYISSRNSNSGTCRLTSWMLVVKTTMSLLIGARSVRISSRPHVGDHNRIWGGRLLSSSLPSQDERAECT